MAKITVFAGSSDKDDRSASIRPHGYIADSDVHETLRQIGLEYKTADYFTQRQVVIMIEPDEHPELPVEIKQKMHELADLLKGRV